MTSEAARQQSRPTILIVHGSWHTPAHYHLLIQSLTAHGFPTVCPPLPSCSNEIALTASLPEDIATIRVTALDLLSHGHSIIAIMHSYGGVVGTEALADLSFHCHAASPKAGGVIALIYMASFMLSVGESLDTAFGGPPPMVRDLEDGTRAIDDAWLRLYSTDLATPPSNYTPEKLNPKAEEIGWLTSPMPGPPATSSLNPLIPQPSANGIMSMLTKQLSSATNAPIKAAAYRDQGIHVTYLVYERDMALPSAAQRGMIERMRSSGVRVEEEVCHGGQSPFLSVPGEVVGVVERAWKRLSRY